MSRKMLSTVLLGLLTALLCTTAAVAGPPPFTTTTLIGGNATPILNGAALLAAVAAATPPELIKLEPGVYDLNGGELVMRNRVDVEGSGRDITSIISSTGAVFTNATVRVPANVGAELRELTVQHSANTSGTGISIASDDFLLTEVNVETKDGGATIGIHTIDSSPRLNEVFVRVLSEVNATGVRITGGGTVVTESFSLVASEGPNNIAWEIEEKANAVLERVVALTFGGKVSNTAVSIHNDARAELNNVRGTAIGGENATGLHLFKNGFGEVKESTFKASSDTFSVAFLLEDGLSKATESTFIADPITFDHLNVFAVRLAGSSSLDSNQSNYDGSAFAVVNAGSGQARFGASQLIGNVISISFTGVQCIFSYRGNYTARNALCV